jgi:hypothetical protein
MSARPALQNAIVRTSQSYRTTHDQPHHLETPDRYINSSYQIVLGSDRYSRIKAVTPLVFAPSLLDVLESESPPDDDFLLFLREDRDLLC